MTLRHPERGKKRPTGEELDGPAPHVASTVLQGLAPGEGLRLPKRPPSLRMAASDVEMPLILVLIRD